MNLDGQLIAEEEGRRNQPYFDSLGYATVGIGRLCDPRKQCPFPDSIIDALFESDLEQTRGRAMNVPGWSGLDQVRRAVIVSMVYQLGYDGVRGFREMCKSLAAGDYKAAARQGLESKWATQDTPQRAVRQMKMLESGIWVPRSEK